jgi:hypothetical protein
MTTLPAWFIETKRRLPSWVTRISCGQPPGENGGEIKDCLGSSVNGVEEIKMVV